jgi:hypothetical protein
MQNIYGYNLAHGFADVLFFTFVGVPWVCSSYIRYDFFSSTSEEAVCIDFHMVLL